MIQIVAVFLSKDNLGIDPQLLERAGDKGDFGRFSQRDSTFGEVLHVRDVESRYSNAEIVEKKGKCSLCDRWGVAKALEQEVGDGAEEVGFEAVFVVRRDDYGVSVGILPRNERALGTGQKGVFLVDGEDGLDKLGRDSVQEILRHFC